MLAMMVSIRETLPYHNTPACFPHRRGGNWRSHRSCYLLFTVLTEIIAITVIVRENAKRYSRSTNVPLMANFGRADVRTPKYRSISVPLGEARLTGLVLDFGEGNGSDLDPGGLIWIQNFDPAGSYLHD